MNVLYYFEPWVELGRPNLRYHNLRNQMGPQIHSLIKNGHDVSVLIGDSTYLKCTKDNYEFDGATPYVIDQFDVHSIFKNYLDATVRLHRNSITLNEKQQLIKLYKRVLCKAKTPDVIISFLTPAEFIKDLFPDAIILYTEFGIFSRAPFPRSFYFDYDGMFGDGFIAKNQQELATYKISPEQKNELEIIRKSFLFDEISRKNPLSNLLIDPAGKYEKIILLPLQFSQYFGFDAHCHYQSQYEFLVDVLERIPNNYGVLVTEHNGWEPVIVTENVEYLLSVYPNLIYKPEIYKYTNASQYILPFVDGVISVSSSVGLQALLWDIPIFCEWKSHLKAFSRVKKLEEIEDYYCKNQADGEGVFDGALYYLLSRYYLSEKYAYDGAFFSSWLETINKNITNGLTGLDVYPYIQKSGNILELLEEKRGKELDRLIVKDQKDSKTPIYSLSNSYKLVEHCRSMIDDHEVVSFDIFDTILLRPFRLPHELFLFIENDIQRIIGDNTFEFHKLRRLSEHLCRQDSCFDEVTLEEIYLRLNLFLNGRLSSDILEKMMQREIAAEFQFCTPRPLAKELYEYAKIANKRIIFISDFYISKKTIDQLLVQKGFKDHERVYVSSNFRKTKKDGGLFKSVITDLSIKPNKIVHFGDNYESDIVNAKKYGLSSRILMKPSISMENNPLYLALWKTEWQRRVFQSKCHQKSSSIMFGLIANKLYDNHAPIDGLFNGNPYYAGYTAFGPLMVAFVRDIIERSIKDKCQVLYFMSRDGWIIKSIYDVLAKNIENAPESRYLYSSRKAYAISMIKNMEDFIDSLDAPFVPMTIRSLLEKRYRLKLLDFIDNDMLISSGLESLEQKIHPIHHLVYLKEFLLKIILVL